MHGEPCVRARSSADMRGTWLGPPGNLLASQFEPGDNCSVRAPQETSAAARHERLLIWPLALTRIVVLCRAASALALHWHATEAPAVVTGLFVLLTLDNVALVIFHLRRGLLNSRCLATLDVCAGMAALVVVVALLKPTANPDTD